MTNIFDNAMSTIFCDINYLEDRHIPSKLIGRDNEIKSVADAYSPILRYENPSNLFLLGQPGTGKSVTNRYVIQELRKQIKKQKPKIDVKHLQVSCRDANTSTAVLHELIEKAKFGTRMPTRGISYKEHLDRFFKIFSDNSNRLIIIELDEIDQLNSDKLLRVFSRAYERLPNNTKLNIVGISNDFNYVEELDPAVLSSLFPKIVYFYPYNNDQIYDILKDRRKAFFNGVVDEATIEIGSGHISEEDGDARRAIKMLKEAGGLADARGSSKVLPAHVTEVYLSRKHRHKVETLKRLTFEQKRVLLAIVELSIRKLNRNNYNSIQSNEVYSTYKNLEGVSTLEKDDFLNTLRILQACQLILMQKNNNSKKYTFIVELDDKLEHDVYGIKKIIYSSISP